MLDFLIENIFVELGERIFQQTIGIPMGTNCTTLLANLFFYLYEVDFIQGLSKKKDKLAISFNYSFHYINDVLSLNNSRFINYIHLVYPNELEIKDTTDTFMSASYLDLFLYIEWRMIEYQTLRQT